MTIIVLMQDIVDCDSEVSHSTHEEASMESSKGSCSLLVMSLFLTA